MRLSFRLATNPKAARCIRQKLIPIEASICEQCLNDHEGDGDMCDGVILVRISRVRPALFV